MEEFLESLHEERAEAAAAGADPQERHDEGCFDRGTSVHAELKLGINTELHGEGVKALAALGAS